MKPMKSPRPSLDIIERKPEQPSSRRRKHVAMKGKKLSSEDSHSTSDSDDIPLAKKIHFRKGKNNVRAVARGVEQEHTVISEEHRDQSALVSSKLTVPKQKNVLPRRMSPASLCTLVRNLSKEQKQAVQDIGFGGLLNLELSLLDGKLLKYLVDVFNISKLALELVDEILVITKDDVYRTLNIPCGNKPVLEGKYDGESVEYSILLSDFKSRWGGFAKRTFNYRLQREQITYNAHKIPEELVKRGDYGDDFKRDFIVFVVSQFLNGHSSQSSNHKILYSLVKVDEIKNLDWCQYTLDHLVQAVSKWKSSPTRFFTGSVAFLTLFYVDRVSFQGRFYVERKFPTLCGWKDDILKKRVKDELAVGGFGKGHVLEALKLVDAHKPIDIQRKTETRDGSSTLTMENEANSDGNEDVKKSHLL